MSSSARKSTSHNNMIKKDFSIKNRRAGMNGVARLTTIAQVIGAVSLPALLVADMLMSNPAWADCACDFACRKRHSTRGSHCCHYSRQYHEHHADCADQYRAVAKL